MNKGIIYAVSLFLIIVFSILALFFVTCYQQIFHGESFTPESTEITLTKKYPLYLTIDGNKVITLKAGERVKILAKHHKDNGAVLLAETTNGVRGLIWDYELSEGIAPQYRYVGTKGNYKMPIYQFYEECIGKSFEEFDGKYRRAIFVPNNPAKCDSVTIPMPFTLYQDDWRAYEPHVVYKKGIATDITYQRIKGGNRLALRIAPLSYWLLEQPIVQLIASKPQFKKDEPLRSSGKVLYYLSFPIRWIGLVLYLLFCGTLPLFAMAIILRWTPIFHFVSNNIMRIILIVLGVLSAYIWWIITMIEGFSWIYAWFPMLSCVTLNVLLSIGFMKFRCEKCKRISNIALIKSSFFNEYSDTYIDTETRYFTNGRREQGDILHQEFVNGELWREWTTKGPIYNEDSGEVINTYKVVYNIKQYRNYYECPKCGEVILKIEDDRKMISKDLLDSKVKVLSNNKYIL